MGVLVSGAKVSEFYRSLHGKHIAVCGLGRNNTPVVLQLLSNGAVVTGCDKSGREELGKTADILENAGATLCLGEGYLDSLLKTGYDMILRTPGMKPYLPQFEEARRQGIAVTSEMELFFSLCPAHITAVTGSDGKTTTATIIAGLLESAGYRVHLGGNIGRPLLPVVGEIRPEDRVVIELSSFQLVGMKQSPQTAVITNIAPNHLDWHTDMQEYINAKRNIILWQGAGDTAVLNADNDYTASFSAEVRGNIRMFSRISKPDFGAWLSSDGILVFTENGKDTPVIPADEICIPGIHNVENYLAAISAVWGSVSPEAIAGYARSFGGVPHRCELVGEIGGVKWYNDSIGTSPSRTIAGLKSFDRRVILIAGGYDKHVSYEELGPVAAGTVKAAILMGETANAIESAISSFADIPVYRVDSMESAVITAQKIAGDGDIVFMSPASASFDLYSDFEERGDHFKRLVMELK